MKQARKNARQPAKFNEVRPTIGARLQPETYEKVIAAASTNRVSISAEIERRIEESFETSVPPELSDLGRRVLAAFEAGGRLEDPEAPVEQWIRDPLQFNRAMSQAFGAMLDAHPHPRRIDLLKLLYAIRSRLEALWLIIGEDVDEMPRLIMPKSPAHKTGDTDGQD